VTSFDCSTTLFLLVTYRRYSHIGLKRIFVFNYNFETSNTSVFKTPKLDSDSLVIFPPDGLCMEGEESMIFVHFKEVMCHTAVKLILLYERLMEVCEEARIKNVLPIDLPLHTVYDDREDISIPKESLNTFMNTTSSSTSTMSTGPSSAIGSTGAGGAMGGTGAGGSTMVSVRNKKLYKKKPSGRLQKWMGDLCMQVCSPIDAVEHYMAAVADCRTLADPLWLAGALDGYASAILLLKEKNYNLEEIIGKDLRSITVNPHGK
jgi:hypothetical protein